LKEPQKTGKFGFFFFFVKKTEALRGSIMECPDDYFSMTETAQLPCHDDDQRPSPLFFFFFF